MVFGPPQKFDVGSDVYMSGCWLRFGSSAIKIQSQKATYLGRNSGCGALAGMRLLATTVAPEGWKAPPRRGASWTPSPWTSVNEHLDWGEVCI